MRIEGGYVAYIICRKKYEHEKNGLGGNQLTGEVEVEYMEKEVNQGIERGN